MNIKREAGMQYIFKSIILILSLANTPLTTASQIVRYQHTDMLGTPVMETDESGNVISRSVYEPFGKRLGGEKVGIGYTGHLQDTDLGLTYMQARYYDPLIGRFYSNDPVGFTGEVDTFNRYSYVANNPYKYTDPTGEYGVLISPKFTPRISPVAQGVRQAINTRQPQANPMQQQTQRIAQQMRDTVQNSKPEVKQPSLKEAPKSPSDTTGGLVTRLIKQLVKHGEDFVGSNTGTNTTNPDSSGSQEMDNDTKRVIAEAQIMMAPPVPVLPEPDMI